MKILTVGGAMIDTIAIIDSVRIERMTMLNADSSFLLLEEGRKTEVEEVSTHPGGGAVNAAVAMARLGMDVALLAKLGTDARAGAILARRAQERVSSQWKCAMVALPRALPSSSRRTTAMRQSLLFAARTRCLRSRTINRHQRGRGRPQPADLLSSQLD